MNIYAYAVIAVVILIIIILVVYFVTKKKNPDPKVQIKEAAEYAKKLETNYKKASFTNAQFLGFADKLYAAMKGVGTDNDAIYFVFKQLKNDTDIYKLIEAFGIRDGETLNQWLTSELSSNERFNLNQITSKYAAYRF